MFFSSSTTRIVSHGSLRPLGRPPVPGATSAILLALRNGDRRGSRCFRRGFRRQEDEVALRLRPKLGERILGDEYLQSAGRILPTLHFHVRFRQEEKGLRLPPGVDLDAFPLRALFGFNTRPRKITKRVLDSADGRFVVSTTEIEVRDREFVANQTVEDVRQKFLYVL